MERNIKEALRAVMLGHAVADALGVPAEFKSRAALKAHPITDMIGYGTHGMPRGTWSDDTSMSLAALDSLGKGWIDYAEIMDNFAKWCFEDKYTATGVTFDVGGTCHAAISAYIRGAEEAPFTGHCDEFSNGNGSLMRIHPFALYLYGKDIDLPRKMKIIHEASSLTHAHERSLVGCGIYALVLWALLEAPSKDSVRLALLEAKEFYSDFGELAAYSRLFSGIESLDEENVKSSGYVVDTLEAAIWCILTTNDYKTCVLKAVNLGEDTDTVAAVAGSLAGAMYGAEGIPDEWLHALIGRDYVEGLCERAAREWCRRDAYRGRLFSILGDSISTLEGYSTPTGAAFYEGYKRLQADVYTPRDTWWGRVLEELGGAMLVNNSISGSLVSKYPLCDIPSYGCSKERASSLGREGATPDVVMVFLGTNDWGYGVKPTPTASDDGDNLAIFSVAYSKMLELLRESYPDAELWCFTLPKSKPREGEEFPLCYGGVHIEKYCDVIRRAALSHSGCRLIDLYAAGRSHSTIDGFHPDLLGMQTVADTVLALLK